MTTATPHRDEIRRACIRGCVARGGNEGGCGECVVPPHLAEQFPSFDLSVLSEKQLAVVEMRFCGGLSFRKIAAFEGVTHQAVICRFVCAVDRLAAGSGLPTRA